MNSRTLTTLSLALLVSVLIPHSLEAQNILYVDSSQTGNQHDGTSWETAYQHLQNALAKADTTETDAIWVSEGTYYPDEGNLYQQNERAASFQLQNSLAIYGGFEGDETQRSNRQPRAHVTTLSGDISQSDSIDHSYHVIKGIDIDSTAVLDGFRITKGYAHPTNTDNDTTDKLKGGGIFLSDASPRLVNLRITNNSASPFHGSGGGVYIDSGAPRLINSRITGNAAILSGGIHNEGGDLTLRNVVIASNGINQMFGGTAGMFSRGRLTMHDVTIKDHYGSAESGDAALTAYGTIKLNNVTFLNNDGGVGVPVSLGGDVTLRNALFKDNKGVATGALIIDGDVLIQNTEFVANKAYRDGAALSLAESGSTMTINTMFAGNKSGGRGGAIAGNTNHHLTMVNTVFSGNQADSSGGALWAKGGTYNLINVTMNANRAPTGKSFAIRDSAHIDLTNTVVWDTRKPPEDTTAHFSIDSTVTGSITHSIIQDSIPGGLEHLEGNLSTQIAFGWPGGSDKEIGTADDNLRLRLNSPGIDEGLTSAFPDSIDVDFEGEKRIKQDTIDIGAYEGGTMIDDIPAKKEVPKEIALLSNYPNPFNPTTTIRFKLPEATPVTLTVYNAIGRRVTTLSEGHKKAGAHHVTFNADHLSSGIYIYRLKTPQKTLTEKMLLVK